MNLKQSLSNFMELTRAYALPVTFSSCLVIWAFAHYSVNFTYFNFALLVIALCCVHLGANLFDDYMDVKNKYKQCGCLENISFDRVVLKANLILNKTFSKKQVVAIFSFLFLVGLSIGIYFAKTVSTNILIIAAVGGLLALFYPNSAKYYLSEVIIGLIYGPLMINGGYYALTGRYSYGCFICSLAVFFTAIILLHTDNIMDWEHDVKENKKTLAIMYKDKNRAIALLRALIFWAYAVIVIAVAFQVLNPKSLYVFLTLPIAVKLPESMNDYIKIKDVKFIPRWYYGPFENWKKIQESRIDFFMYRMYLARNFVLLFSLFLAIGTIR